MRCTEHPTARLAAAFARFITAVATGYVVMQITLGLIEHWQEL